MSSHHMHVRSFFSPRFGIRASMLLRAAALACLASLTGLAAAQENAIQSISANQQGANIIVRVAMKNPVAKSPIGFSITSPARIALDFPSTARRIQVDYRARIGNDGRCKVSQAS